MARDDDYDDDRDDMRDPAPFPTKVKIAGVIWIIFGVLGLLNTIYQIVSGAAAQQGGAGSAGPICGGLFAIAFLLVGFQTVKGTAKGVMGNGIGSIVISLLLLLGAGVMLVGFAFADQAAEAARKQQAQNPNANNPIANMDTDELKVMLLVTGGILLLQGGMLFIAGVLALLSKTEYQNWRETQGLGQPKRRRRRPTRDADADVDE